MAKIEPIIQFAPVTPLPLNYTRSTTALVSGQSHFELERHILLDFNEGVAAGTYAIWPFGKNTWVKEVNTLVVEALTAAVTTTIGDGVDPDGFLASADIAPQNIGTSAHS